MNKLIDLTGGRLSSDQFESVLSLLEKESAKYFITSSSEANLIRIFSAVHDKVFFFQELIKYPHHSEILIAISASSDYLTDIVVRNPEFLYQVFDQAYLAKIFEYEFYKREIEETVKRFNTFKAKLNFLRQIKKRFILKIGLSDILQIAQLKTVTEQLSFLAIAINQKLFELCYQEVLSKNNMPSTDHKYCLCSLGKLGGNELNYSSDIDLLLFYDSNEELKDIDKDFSEILSDAAQLYIKSSTEISDHGFIYRVDFRLRPDGKYSPLCRTITDYTRYYETRGEDWERQMLIKLNFICGDEALFNQFNNFIQSYIYSFSYTSSVKDKIKQMKVNIERQIIERENVKTFTGGIRDIEFTVQALQLLNGEKFKNVRTTNTLNAIYKLSDHGFFKKNEQRIFSDSYIFYRKIEHFLQLMNNRQTHIIPQDKELLGKMINYLKFKTTDEFKKKLKFYRDNVRKIYNDVLKSDEVKVSDNTKSIKFTDIKKSKNNLKFLRTGAGLIDKKEFDSRTIELFSRIEPQLLKYLKKSTVPQSTLENLTKVIRASKNTHIWYKEFTNEIYFKNFLDICTYSQKAIDLISSDYSLEEFYLSGNAFLKDHDAKQFSIKQNILYASIQFVLGEINNVTVSEILSTALSGLITKSFIKFISKNRIIIIGAGSFGTQSFDFGSDADLIAFSEKPITSEKILNDFLKCVNSFKETIKPIEVDFRLRPEGKNSQLIWDLENYQEYLRKRARTWEYQSILKYGLGFGDKDLLDRFKIIVKGCFELYDKSNLRTDIINMYKLILKDSIRHEDASFNIKKDKGGFLTIDFILQCLLLTTEDSYSIGFKLSNVLTFLKRLITDNDSKTVYNNFNFLKRVAMANQIIFNTGNSVIPANIEKRTLLAKFLKFKLVTDFDKRISEIIKSNNFLFEKYVGN